MSKKSEPEHKPRLGASWRAGTTAAVVLAPVTDEVINSVQSKNFKSLAVNLKNKTLSIANGMNLGIATVDAGLDAKLGHAAALSRGSITAWAPELIRLGAAASNAGLSIGGSGKVDARAFNAGFSKATTGFDSRTGTWNVVDAIPYQASKHGLQIVRRIAARPAGARVLDPVKKGLKVAGLTF